MPDLPEGWSGSDNGLLGFFSGLVEEGHSQNSAINAYRSAGGTGSNDVLRGAYDLARDYAEARPEGWGLSLDQAVPIEAHTMWPSIRGDGYGYPMQVHIQNLEGDQEMIRTMVYSSEPLSPDEAFMRAANQLLDDDSVEKTGNTAKVFGAVPAGSPLAFFGL